MYDLLSLKFVYKQSIRNEKEIECVFSGIQFNINEKGI